MEVGTGPIHSKVAFGFCFGNSVKAQNFENSIFFVEQVRDDNLAL